MNGNPQLVMAPDARLVPSEDVDATVRGKLDLQPGEGVLSRRRGRSPGMTISCDAVRLLRCFSEPTTVVDAVIELAGTDPATAETTLQEILPTLQRWLRQGILVDAAQTDSLQQLLEPGDRHDGFCVARVLQILDDSEVYQVRLDDGVEAALKIERGRSAVGSSAAEAEILAQRPTECLPELLARGDIGGHSYLLLTWCRGVSAEVAAKERRASGQRGALLDLCRRIAEAYGTLHDAGYLHGDVHPRNLLVDRDGSVRLIDLGLACRQDDPPRAGRGRPGVPFYFEPEHARSMEAGRGPRPVTAAGEQFAVAALLYFLLCGVHYCDFDLHRETLFRRIIEAEPQSFASRGLSPWPSLEKVLKRGLAPYPDDRFASMGEFAAALAALSAESGLGDPPAFGTPAFGTPAVADQHMVDRVVQAAALDGPWWRQGLTPSPTATVKFGAGGIALALCRIAGVLQDGEILALADVWGQRAARDIADGAGLYNADLDINLAKTGTTSPFHTASGIAAVQGFLAKARGNVAALYRAVHDFVATSNVDERESDLTLGRAGSLLLCALLRDVVRDWRSPREPSPTGCRDALEMLDALGRRLADDLERELADRPALTAAGADNLTVAHGWGGYLYALLQWHRAADSEVPAAMVGRLEALARLGYGQGRGRRWGWRLGTGWTSSSGWCNGSAGMVFLWNLAARVLDEPTYHDFAVDAAWDVWESPGRLMGLCCGLTGQAYALLNMAKHSVGPQGGGDVWIERARHLARRAARRSNDGKFVHSLYKGETGLAVLQADLLHPETAAMPFFEDEAVGLARPSHQIPTARPYVFESTALRCDSAQGRTASTTASLHGSKPCISKDLRPLATKSGDPFGLGGSS